MSRREGKKHLLGRCSERGRGMRGPSTELSNLRPELHEFDKARQSTFAVSTFQHRGTLGFSHNHAKKLREPESDENKV